MANHYVEMKYTTHDDIYPSQEWRLTTNAAIAEDLLRTGKYSYVSHQDTNSIGKIGYIYTPNTMFTRCGCFRVSFM